MGTITTYEELNDFVVREEIYLKIDLTPAHLAQACNLDPDYLIRLIMEGTRKDFDSWINTYRCEEGQRLITKGIHEKRSLEDVGRWSGFSGEAALLKALTNRCEPAFLEALALRASSSS